MRKGLHFLGEVQSFMQASIIRFTQGAQVVAVALQLAQYACQRAALDLIVEQETRAALHGRYLRDDILIIGRIAAPGAGYLHLRAPANTALLVQRHAQILARVIGDGKGGLLPQNVREQTIALAQAI